MFAFFNARIGTEFQSTTINETLKELFLWSRVNEHLPTTGIFKPLYADNLTFTGWRSSLGDMFSKYSTGITLHWAPIGRFIFDMRNVNQIFRGFLKIDRIKEKFVFVSRRWFSFSLFIFVESFSITWTALLKMVFPIKKVQLQMRQYIFWNKILSKDKPSFQRRNWFKKWKLQWSWNAMQYEQNQTWWMWMRWTLICKINEMEMNDEMNELDFGIWNEWDESDYANM